jgi:polysaccharide export outer membrane protein
MITFPVERDQGESMSRYIAQLVIAMALLPGCAGSPSVRVLVAPRPPTVDATLGIGDLFDVRVFEEPDLSATYRVGPEGTIDYPLVGRVQVAGRLPGDVARAIEEQLRQYVRGPQVSVLVREMNSKRVIVYGQVQKPGTFPYTDPMTISQAISLAGGFTAMALRESVRISRAEHERQEIIEVNLRQIAEGKVPNAFLSPGDEIYVPERTF